MNLRTQRDFSRTAPRMNHQRGLTKPKHLGWPRAASYCSKHAAQFCGDNHGRHENSESKQDTMTPDTAVTLSLSLDSLADGHLGEGRVLLLEFHEHIILGSQLCGFRHEGRDEGRTM